MPCPRCPGHDVFPMQGAEPNDARFCEECGARLMLACPQCGGETSPWKKFCRACGTALSGRVPDRPLSPASYTPKHHVCQVLLGDAGHGPSSFLSRSTRSAAAYAHLHHAPSPESSSSRQTRTMAFTACARSRMTSPSRRTSEYSRIANRERRNASIKRSSSSCVRVTFSATRSWNVSSSSPLLEPPQLALPEVERDGLAPRRPSRLSRSGGAESGSPVARPGGHGQGRPRPRHA